VPQAPTRWLEPKLLVLIAVQVALSTKFAEFFDRRDAHVHLPETTHAGAAHGGVRAPDCPVGGAASASRWSLTETAQGFDFTGTDELWLDYVADSGDGFDATTTIALEIWRELMKLRDLHEGQDVIVRVNPVVYSSMQPSDPIFEETERNLGVHLVFKPDDSLHHEQFDVMRI